MEACFLPCDKPAATYPYFPDPALLVIFRNWGMTEPERIAKALDTTVERVTSLAERMGLPPHPTVSPLWHKRGFLTVIRNNWNLLEYDQLLVLLDMTEEQLEFTLHEDDFMWEKMGALKPTVQRPTLKRPLSAKAEKRVDEIGRQVRELHMPEDNAFAFLEHFFSDKPTEITLPQQEKLRLIHSYFSLYGDTLANDAMDSYPDALLADYAANGINGIWLQGLLRQLAPNPWDDPDYEKRPARLMALRALVNRAAKYGIGVYLYLNEPRPMSEEFFERFPHLRGAKFGIDHCLCTSLPEVSAYLEQASEYLFRAVPGLAGFFSISFSENHTNCASRGDDSQPTCPRCKDRPREELMAIINNSLARGAHRANPRARALVYTWSWEKDWDATAVKLLTEGQYVLSVSEEKLPYTRGGISNVVRDYAMSLPGPSENSLRRWNAAKEMGVKTAAKVQINGSWELSSMPFVPLFGLIGEHLENLRNEGIENFMLTWTVGGSPSPVADFACRFLDGDRPLAEALPAFLKATYGEAAETVDAAQKLFCEAFREYPFYVETIYNGPHTFGPMAPFFDEPTGCAATMVGFPYDDLDGWRQIYPAEVYASQFEKMVTGWKKGLDILDANAFDTPEYRSLCCMAWASYCHLASAYHHIRFVMARDAGDTATMLETVRAEREVVAKTVALRLEDSRIGFEASNQYYFTVKDLIEKQLNLNWLEEKYR